MDIKFDVKGLEEQQQRNRERIAKMQPGGELENTVRRITLEAQRQAINVTHVDTGALRASHRIKVDSTTGRVFIDPAATNPRSSKKVTSYAIHEHNRGGSHAFYAIAALRTQNIVKQETNVLVGKVIRL